MALRLMKTEPYPSELPTTPPTPHSSPTLRPARLHTPLGHKLPKDRDPVLRSLTCGHRRAFSLPKNPKVTGKYVTRPSNTQRQPHPTLIGHRTQNDAPHHERGQQRCSLATRFSRERPAPNDVSAWWRDTNVVGSSTQAATPASILLDFGQIKASRMTSGQAAIRYIGQGAKVALSGTGAGDAVEAVRISVG
ncbi:hypothetical protein BGZ57DRAFT_1008492 [Hyaloscypha finlandica]|nr:hypothetical protein BGZ57DRAFT_1008492 [Hyaloscypha finlandica]